MCAPASRRSKTPGTSWAFAGNQTTRAGHFLRELNLPCDVLATSDDWGVTKPDVAFAAAGGAGVKELPHVPGVLIGAGRAHRRPSVPAPDQQHPIRLGLRRVRDPPTGV